MLEKIYIKIRLALRNYVIKRPFIDLYFGNYLVNLDISIRRLGILKDNDKYFIHHNGFKINYLKDDYSLINFIKTNNDYEEATRRVVERILKKGDIFLDLGSHIGFYALIAARIVGETGHVYAFEPTPATRDTLDKNVIDNGLKNIITVESFGVSDCSKNVNFIVNSDSSECNKISQFDEGVENLIKIKTISIDKYAIINSIKKINLVKMDIEGAEYQAIIGMRKIISENPDIKLIFEYNRKIMNENGSSRVNIFNILKELGFNKFTIIYRGEIDIEIPRDFELIDLYSKRDNINILVQKIRN
ncbi:FkbM family methyltransferase [Polynucleobacter sp. 73C-SIWE]|uniref:FkbM family methyltransferase n=1 Tax=Polynucleobacter sp. 73C-SIWE TaxID=2689098 RepID=UPI001C0D349A|nr:FkbM family methyltransferase [Polynucleobacter sp. 73C-SIWE]MBU3578636.1 FkbM family methyltransferase [Polynucleobacter sp. 73C-SIWE]